METGRQHPDLLTPLTERELEILRLIDEGLSNGEIANRLFLSLDTIKWYSKQLYSKLGVNSRTQALARARQLHLFSSPPLSSTANVSQYLPAQPDGMTEWSATRLPVYFTPFVGRAEDLKSIAERLHDPRCHLLSLIGPGGIGKTRLALQCAADPTLPFVDGVAFVSLASVSSPDLIPSAIATALHFSFYGTADTRAQVLRLLSEKHLLLLLDNFEHLLDGADLLADILQSAPDVTLLVTSRERLNLQEEWVRSINGLSFPLEQLPDEPTHYSAVQLFIQRAQQIQPHFSFKDQLGAVTRICQQVEGMPLALELAASWLRVLSSDQIAAQIEGDLNFLTTRLRNVPERHRSLQAVFDQSWTLLPPVEQAVMKRLSVFQGGFDLEAAEQVAGASLLHLASLVDKSLIRLNENERYDLHELLRHYAEAKLSADEARIVATQHLNYFLNLVEQAEVHQYGPDHTVWLDRLDRELDNLRAALTSVVEGGPFESGLRMVAALRSFWDYRGHFLEGYTWSERLLAVSNEASPTIRAKALERAGDLAEDVGRVDRAKELFTEALTLARTISDLSTTARALSGLGRMYRDTDRLQEAVAPLEESLALFRGLDDPYGLSHALRRRAWLAKNLQDYGYAQALLKESLVRDRAAGDKTALAWSLSILGEVLYLQGNHVGEITARFEESASLFLEVGNGVGAHRSLVLLGSIARLARDYSRAQAVYEQALAIAPNAWAYSLSVFALALAGLAMLPHLQDKPERAVRLLAAQAKWFTLLDDPFCSAETISQYARSLRARLGEAAYQASWNTGYAMTTRQVIAYALQPTQT